jgi:hypothetical protein
MFRASSCPSSGEQYKTDNTYGVQHWPCCSRLEEKRWFGVHLLGMVLPINISSFLHLVGYLFTFMIQDARSHDIKNSF